MRKILLLYYNDLYCCCFQARADGSRARRGRVGVRGQAAGGGGGGAAAAPADRSAVRPPALPAGAAAAAPARIRIRCPLIQVRPSIDHTLSIDIYTIYKA